MINIIRQDRKAIAFTSTGIYYVEDVDSLWADIRYVQQTPYADFEIDLDREFYTYIGTGSVPTDVPGVLKHIDFFVKDGEYEFKPYN